MLLHVPAEKIKTFTINRLLLPGDGEVGGDGGGGVSGVEELAEGEQGEVSEIRVNGPAY
jgi:hypothetical protein